MWINIVFVCAIVVQICKSVEKVTELQNIESLEQNVTSVITEINNKNVHFEEILPELVNTQFQDGGISAVLLEDKNETSEYVRVQKNAPDIYEESIEIFRNVDYHVSVKLGDQDRENGDRLLLRRDKYGLQVIVDPLHKEIMSSAPTAEQRSLVIVFDGTASMVNDLAQLTKGAEAIIAEVTQRQANLIYNYIFVPFRDPYVGPKLVTQNLSTFLHEIKKLPLLGGGDCPESAVGGIHLALESALPKSFVYVFTDATARDFALDAHTIDLIQEKQATLTFLLTGFCTKKSSEGYKVFERLASISNGQIYNLQKTDIGEVLEGITAYLDSDIVSITYLYSNTSGPQSHYVPVDENLREFTVSLAGEKLNISVRNPNKEEHKDISEILNLSNLKVINVKDPQPGTWNVETDADSEHSVKLTALSNLKFEFGFSKMEPKNMADTFIIPTSRTPNVFSVSPSDDALVHNMTTVEFILHNAGVPNVTLPLRRIDAENNSTIYSTTPFSPPITMFKIYVNGFDTKGNPLKQLLSTSIKAIAKDMPKIFPVNDYVEIFEEEDTFIECTVVSSSTGNILWHRNNLVVQKNHIENGISVYRYEILKAKLEDGGHYLCSIQNENGFDEKTITVIIKKKIKPISVNLPKQMIATEKDVDFQMTCFVHPSQNISYKWFFNNEEIKSGDNFDIENENLILKTVRRGNIGNYTCLASNEDVEESSSGYLDVLYGPIVNGPTIEELFAVYGMDTQLTCESDANPSASIEWIRDPANENFENGTIQDFSVVNEGIYICRLSNGIGNVVEKKFNVSGRPKDPPKIFPLEKVVNIIIGEDISLSCKCELCAPIVKHFWHKLSEDEDVNVNQPGKLITKVYNNSQETELLLQIEDVDVEDEGVYLCFLENERGFDEKEIKLQVYEPAAVESVEGLYKDQSMSGTVNVIQGDDMHLQCTFSGHPAPTVQWVKHGIPVSGYNIAFQNQSSKLLLENVTVKDEGSYECAARNLYGHNSKHIYVNVVVPPKLKSFEDSILIADSGQQVLIECDVLGEPFPKISWIFNTSNNDILNITNINTNILNFTATRDHSGAYKCLAENEAGKVTKTTILLVSFEPKLYPREDEEVNTSIGDDVTLICRAEGYPEPHIHWGLNGTLLTSSNNATVDPSGDLILKNITTSHTGIYVCSATNRKGVGQRTIRLNVNYPPKIVSTLPTTFKILPNYMTSFDCAAEGSPTPKIYWTKNGTIISADGPNSHILSIISSGENESGDYVCHAVNSEGEVSWTIQISSVEKPYLNPVHLDRSPKNISQGEGIKLLCPLIGANNLSWYHNNKILEHINLKELEIEDASVENGGNYTCVGENEAGSEKYTQEVLVWSPPSIKDDGTVPSDVYNNKIPVRLGKGLTIQCEADGYPPPKVQWLKDTNVVSTNSKLHLENIQFYHAGKYKCIAKNIFGSDEMSYTIDVLIPPILEIPKNNWKEAFEGVDIQFVCEAYGNPEPNVVWTKNGEYLPEYNKKLEIFNAHIEDRGKYTCKLRNSVGENEIIFNLDVLVPPRFTSVPQQVTILNNDLLELHCSAEGNPPPMLAWGLNSKILLSSASAFPNEIRNETDNSEEIVVDDLGNVVDRWYIQSHRNTESWRNLLRSRGLYGKIQKRNDGTELSLLIADSKLKKSGLYVCYAINSLGIKEQVFPVEIHTLPYLSGRDGDQQPFVHQTLLDGLPLILSCLWSGTPAPQISWYHNDKFLNERNEYRLSKDNRTLTVLHSNASQSGLYTCIASNAVGEDRRQFLVDILVPPRFNDFVSESALSFLHTTGKSTILECPAVGYPRPKIFWSRQDENSDMAQILPETSSQLVLDDLEESGIYSCYVNNSLGFVEKKFSVEVKKMPRIEDTWPQQDEIEEYKDIILRCQVVGNPKPIIRWYKDGKEINNFPHVHFSKDGSVLKIPNARTKDSGVYICIAGNVMGEVQRNVNITVKRSAVWSAWEPWTPCSSSCGLGVKTRKRRCIVNGNVMKNENQCAGANYESERCQGLPCPLNGGWSRWSNWTSCSKNCMDINDIDKPTRKRYRNCDNPKPAYGGKHCFGMDYEEAFCNDHFCPIHGGWSKWTKWTSCSVSCGSGLQQRFRECNNPSPKFGGSDCFGPHKETMHCFSSSCVVHGDWSEWSLWSECSQTCGNGVKKRTRTCTSPSPKNGGDDCQGSNVEVSKCQLPKCPNSMIVENLFAEKQYLSANSYESSELLFTSTMDGDETVVEPGHNYQYALAHPEVLHKDVVSEDYYDDQDPGKKRKVTVTYQNYRPISPDIKQITFFPDKNSFKVERIIPCQLGFELSLDGECVDVNECNMKDICAEDQICTNFVGSFKCTCRRGFDFNKNTGKCEDIDECLKKSYHGCSHNCKNTFGSYFCTCPKGYTLGKNKRTCEELLASFKGEMMSDLAFSPNNSVEVKCLEGYEKMGTKCQDVDECAKMAHDCGKEQSCLNTKGSYICIPTPCEDGYDRDEESNQCVQMCEVPDSSNESNCMEEAKISQMISYTLLSLNEFNFSEPFLKIVNYGIDRKALQETLFMLETGKDSHIFRLETLPFRKGMSYLYATKKLTSEKLYNIKVKAKSYDPKTYDLLYVTKFVIFLYML